MTFAHWPANRQMERLVGQEMRGAASQAAALRTALAQLPPGSKIMGLSLAHVKGFGFGTDRSRAQLAWLVSVDPYGGAYGAGGSLGCGRITYDVELIDPGTGRWLMATSGRQPGMTPLPILGPTPTLAQPSPSCGIPNGHMHQGTPAAYSPGGDNSMGVETSTS